MTSLHHSWLALEPSMALGSFSLSLLIQVHEAAAVEASGGDAGDDGGDGGVTQRTTTTRTVEMYDVALQRTTAARYRGRSEQRSCIA